MGNEILYCSKCQTRLLKADFDAGTAFRIEGVASCDKCSPDVLKLLPPEKIQEFLHRVSKARKGSPPPEKSTPKPENRGGTNRARAGKEGLGAGAWIGAGVGAVALLGLIVMATRGSDPPDPAPETAASRKTPLSPRPQSPQVAADLADYDQRVKEAIDRKEPGPAMKLIQDSRARHGASEWTAFIDRKFKELRDAAFAHCAALKEKALEAQRKGSGDEVKALREQVAKMGVPELLADFDRALKSRVAATAPESPKPSGNLPRARIVRIENPNPILNMAEVQVFSAGENVALKGAASQISTYEGGEASHAIDGNTTGEWASKSVSHTLAKEELSWWEVDLGRTLPIERVVVWNRTEALQSRMKGYSVVLLDEARNPVAAQKSEGYPDPSAEHVFGAGGTPRPPEGKR